MSDHLNALRVFVRVAHTGSFSHVAREQSLTQPTVSRMVAQLEERLGAALFLRTTRAVTLTEVGAEYLARVQPALDALDEADFEARGSRELRGTLRVGVSSITASRMIVPNLQPFMDRHPVLRIEFVIDDRRQDLLVENVDVALRSGKLEDSSSLARRIGRWPLVVAAAPSYLSARGVPKLPDDLVTHTFIVAGPAAGQGITLTKDGQEITVPVLGNIVITGTEVAINAGSAGLGILTASYPSVRLELQTGKLVRLLPDWNMGAIDVHALFPGGQTPKPAARMFIDYLSRCLETDAEVARASEA